MNFSVLIASIISVLAGIVVTFISSTSLISMRIFVVYICISLFIIWLLLIIVFSPQKVTNGDLSLKLVKFFNDNTNSICCILQPCSYVSQGSFVTFFYLDNELEIYFSTGVIYNIQNNDLIQVNLQSITQDTLLLNKINNNNTDFIKSIIVKPIVTNNFLERGSI
ncbi:hypothetical protein LL033_10045 [Clostridium estertheticum]|nr:hypothetical protein [Clostridium estertheticum]WAG57496.1 hypothetical protein LL033_10045 [Clostridium estertheticum]